MYSICLIAKTVKVKTLAKVYLCNPYMHSAYIHVLIVVTQIQITNRLFQWQDVKVPVSDYVRTSVLTQHAWVETKLKHYQAHDFIEMSFPSLLKTKFKKKKKSDLQTPLSSTFERYWVTLHAINWQRISSPWQAYFSIPSYLACDLLQLMLIGNTRANMPLK